MKPQEYDVVRLLKQYPDQGLQIGATGTVVMDYSKHAVRDLPPAYEVEFADADGVTQALVTVPESDLEVVWREDDGPHSS
ncbi:hypothetical protein BH10ACT9_BH10ACT9_44000 [soil metagenome]